MRTRDARYVAFIKWLAPEGAPTGALPSAAKPASAGWVRGRRPSRALPLALLALVALLAVCAAQMRSAPIAWAQGATRQAPTHALPVRSIPAADAILSAPPSQVQMWFSEALNPLDSRIVVVDPSNHEVDARDSHVSTSDPTEMDVGLQLLRPGAYVVVWRTQSAVDGHVTGGSFLFRIANADGSVPPVPATLPSGNVPGAAGFGSSAQTVDGPTLLQAFSDWMALLFALFWVGGVIWEVWALPERRAPNAVVALGARLGARRFQRLAPYALAGALIADLGVALALTAEVAGSWRGVFDGQYWQATLLSGSFAVYWWMRQVVLAVALALAALAVRNSRREAATTDPQSAALTTPSEPIDALTDI
ncbi:MAG TPA: copper resistance CopC family protein, partial [Ktedonobacterales bacterium]